MASNLTRKELLKQDKFTVEAEHTVDYLSAHRKEVVRYGTVALVVIVLVAAVFYYRSSRASVREQILGEAIALDSVPVGQAPPGGQSFPTQAAKNDAVTKAFAKLASDYSGSEEAYIAEYYLGAKALDAGNVDEARRKFQDAADHGNANYASLARLALAQLDYAQNRTAEAETLLKSLMDHPTDLVSKEQAEYTWAKTIAPTKPEEARKLFQQLVSEKTDVSQIAQAAMNELPQK